MLKRRVLGRLGEVAVHLACGREDALDAGRGGRHGKVLLDHLGQVGPLRLLLLPPQQHLDVNLRLLGVGEVLYCSSSSSAVGGAGLANSFLIRPPRRPPSDTLRCLVGRSAASSVATAAAGAATGAAAAASGRPARVWWSSQPEPAYGSAVGSAAGLAAAASEGVGAGAGANVGVCFHTVAHSVRSSRSAQALSLSGMSSMLSTKSYVLKHGWRSEAIAYVRLASGARLVIHRRTQSSYMAVRALSIARRPIEGAGRCALFAALALRLLRRRRRLVALMLGHICTRYRTLAVSTARGARNKPATHLPRMQSPWLKPRRTRQEAAAGRRAHWLMRRGGCVGIGSVRVNSLPEDRCSRPP